MMTAVQILVKNSASPELRSSGEIILAAMKEYAAQEVRAALNKAARELNTSQSDSGIQEDIMNTKFELL